MEAIQSSMECPIASAIQHLSATGKQAFFSLLIGNPYFLTAMTEKEMRSTHSRLLELAEIIEKKLADGAASMPALPESPTEERACDSDRCTYRCGAECGILPESSTGQEEASAEPAPLQDNWVQCNECDSWHKIESLEDLPDQWFCEDIGKICRPSRAAEAFWPASRAKRIAKHYGAGHLSHYNALKYLAERKDMSVEELYKISHQDYVGRWYVGRL